MGLVVGINRMDFVARPGRFLVATFDRRGAHWFDGEFTERRTAIDLVNMRRFNGQSFAMYVCDDTGKCVYSGGVICSTILDMLAKAVIVPPPEPICEPRKVSSVVFVDTFDGGDCVIGDYDTAREAKTVARSHSGTMQKAYVYDDKGRQVGNFGSF